MSYAAPANDKPFTVTASVGSVSHRMTAVAPTTAEDMQLDFNGSTKSDE